MFKPKFIYYEKEILDYSLGKELMSKYKDAEKIEIEKYHKYQVAFKNEFKLDDFKDIEFIKFESDKRIIKVVCKYDLPTFSKMINKFEPLIIDEITIDFEEMFIIEVESKGYLK